MWTFKPGARFTNEVAYDPGLVIEIEILHLANDASVARVALILKVFRIAGMLIFEPTCDLLR
jgi:hypothetical protein